MNRRPRTLPLLAATVTALALAACTANPGPPPASVPASPAPPGVETASPAASPNPVATASPATPASAYPTEAPGAPSSGAPGTPPVPGGSGGSTPGITPIPIDPGGPGFSIGPIQVQPPTLVRPVASLLNVHDVRAESVAATVSAGHVIATVVWWSGPAPCSELSEVSVARSGSAFTLTVREGTRELGIACPAIAVHKEASVDLGVLAAGSYTVAATGVDAPVTVTVPG